MKNAVNFLQNLRGAKFVSLVTRTNARARKPYKDVEKVSKVTVLFNFDYEKGVFRRLTKEGKDEGEFVQGESWHVPVLDSNGKYTPFCKHKDTGELYFRCQFVSKTGDSVFFGPNNTPIEPDEIAAFLPKASTYSNQGLDEPLIFLTYKVSSIVEATVDGQTEYFS